MIQFQVDPVSFDAISDLLHYHSLTELLLDSSLFQVDPVSFDLLWQVLWQECMWTGSSGPGVAFRYKAETWC